MALPKQMRLKGHRTFKYIHKNSKKYYGKLMDFKGIAVWVTYGTT